MLLATLQPPSGGCELKLSVCFTLCCECWQPPSGGCELKRYFVAQMC